MIVYIKFSVLFILMYLSLVVKYAVSSLQSQFNNFVLTLRGGYSNKVETFRQVIEVHRLELAQKQQYWDEALQSLTDKNKGLLEDKKKLLIQNKLEYERLEKEKVGH